MTTVDFAIATHKPSGIRRLAECNLPALPGVRYVVSWQNHEDAPIPQTLDRPDITIHRYDGQGQSNNRNNAITRCTADVIVTSDDDLEFFPEGIRALQQTYSENPDIDFIVFRAIHETLRKPDRACHLSYPLPKDFFVGCIELSFRRKCGLLCCPDLGLGSPAGMDGGEDELLFATALRRGLNCWYFPITVCRHDHPSTGSKAHLTPGNLRAAGCVIALTFPWWQTMLRVPLKIWRISRQRRAPLGSAILNVTKGALAARRLRRRNRNYLW